jgi:hypothetical protein
MADDAPPADGEEVADVEQRIRTVHLTRAEYAALEESSSASSIQVLAAGLGKQGISTWADTLRAVFVGLSAGLLRTAGWPEACLRKPSLSDS